MNKDIKIISEDEEFYYIHVDKKENCKYIVVGMNDIFNFETVLISESNYIKLKKSKVNKYIKIRVNYIITDENINKDILVDHTNDLTLSSYINDNINIKWIESYKGMTMAFISDIIYDKYLIYERQNNHYVILYETEDFQVTSNAFKINSYYYVEAYKKENDEYILTATSKKTKCQCTYINHKNTNLSIVVPIYNSEKFLCRCLDSVLLSTFNEYELILVDDGSIDESSKIIDWYQEKYKEIIKTIHKKNQGISFARNDGIKLAVGKYIAFLDSDDLVHPFMYENLYHDAIKYNLDIVIGKALIRNDDNKYSICLDIKNVGESTLVYTYDQMIANKNSYENIFFVAVWNKIIKTDIIKAHPFPAENLYEDIAFTNNIYSYIDRFGFNKNSYYIWDKRQRKTTGTLSTTYDKKNALFRHQKYCEAMFYSVYNGNQLRINQLVYNAIKEVITYVKKINIFDDKNLVFSIYKEAINKINKIHNIKNNPYIIKDKQLYDDVNKIIQ